MSTFRLLNHHAEHYWRDLAVRIGLVLLTTFVIVWSLPKDETKQFVYDVGEPWHYGTIIAKYDFPVYKTDEALAKERDSLLHLFQPYYFYDSSIEDKEINDLRSHLAKVKNLLPTGFEEAITTRLHHMYQAGIMETPNYNSMHTDTTKLIRVIFGKDAESVPINSVYSTMSVYEQLMNDPLLEAERPLMQRLNLTDYIMPNLILDQQRTTQARNDLLSSLSRLPQAW